MTRKDANRIALRAVSAILDAAVPLTVRISDDQIAVTPERLPPPPWPEQRLDGISEQADGPWPAPVKLKCEWSQGRCDLMLSATHWQARAGRQVSLSIVASETNRAMVWITVAGHVRDARDGDEAQVYASHSLVDRSSRYDQIREALNQKIRELVHDAKLPMLSPGRVDAFRMKIPGGEVLPAPAQAYANLVRLALLKLPFRDVGAQRAIHGRPYIDVDALVSRARDDLQDRGAQTASGKYIVMRRMPGGYRGYKASLDRVLQFLADSPATVEALDRFLENELDISNATMRRRNRHGYEDMGLIRAEEGKIELTERARAYLADPSEAHLFKVLHETYEGLLATLVVASRDQGADSSKTPLLLAALCDLPDLAQQQAERRRNWLTSLGFTERIGGTDRVTAAGRAILAEYAEEVDELAARLEEVESTPASESESASGSDVGDELDDQESVAPEEKEHRQPRNWAESRLDLQAPSVAPHTGKLVLPHGLLDRICAVLSAGKHLLLVGPPGTGKTELAHALARAAKDEGYCAGLFSATASADWTTYETIGGYAIQRDGSLRFRPGAFLRAVELWQWLLIDELNRADVDKAFGELMSVLSGKHTDTPYELDDGSHVSIGNHDRQYTHWVPSTFRVLATMNTWDKTSLFRLSYALQRRFAVVHVGVPAAEHYASLIEHAATVAEADPRLDEKAIARLQQLFSAEGLLAHRAIGPAMALDMVRYMRRRQSEGDAMAEAMAMFLLPQLEGLERNAAKGAGRAILDALEGWTSKDALQELDERYRELFPSSKGLGE